MEEELGGEEVEKKRKNRKKVKEDEEGDLERGREDHFRA